MGTGYAFCMGACFGCGRIFTFNPLRVPSINIDGNREPICADCVARANPLRKANGLPEIVPAADAYEACEADALD